MAKNVRLHPLVRQKLKELPAELKRDWGLPATQETVVAALIHETSVGQAAGMLMAYTRHLATVEPENEDEAADDEDAEPAARFPDA